MATDGVVPEINVIIKGGVIQSIFSTIPHVNIYIHDLDTEEVNEEKLDFRIEEQYKNYG